MKKQTIITALLALAGLTAGAQELTWQKYNENLPGDIHIMPVRCHDNNHQKGAKASIEYTIDGDKATNWHSAFYPEHKKVTPETPAELVYEFEDMERIDRMVYVPRQDGSPNGYVTEAEVLVKTATDRDFVSQDTTHGRATWSLRLSALKEDLARRQPSCFVFYMAWAIWVHAQKCASFATGRA